jgi:hypothetical protein
MRRFAVILVLLVAGRVFGQSGLYNVSYRPQPRVIIPTVEPSAAIVSNNTVIVNPNKDLRFCDFYLAAVDQTGAHTNPVLFEYSSVSTNQQAAAVVFYQRSGQDYPASLLRRLGATITITNQLATVTNQTVGVFTNWNSVVSATNFPTWVYVGEYYYHQTNSSLFVTNSEAKASTTLYAPVFKTSGAHYYGATGAGGSSYRAVSGTFDQFEIAALGDFWLRDSITAPEETNFWYTAAFTNYSSEIVSANVLSVQAASSNEASAVEVFPLRQGQKWMKQTNPDVKWMCLLSNGLEWYSTPAGDPIWFNCAVEWVDRIPEILQ